MAGPVPIFSQARSHQYIYLLKQKGDELLVRIYNYARDCLYKEHFAVRDLKLPENVNITLHPRRVIDHLFAKQVIGSEFAFPKPPVIELKECKERIKEAIKAYEPKVDPQFDLPRSLCCPISLEAFQEPVVDEQGHTHDEPNLDQLFAGNEEIQSPINREIIRRNNFRPNFAVKGAIEELREKHIKSSIELVPNSSQFEEENAGIADLNIRLARAYLEKRDFVEAEAAYKRAVKHSKDLDLYREIIRFYDKADLEEKELLSRLYLAKTYLDENEPVDALEILRRVSTHSQDVIEVAEALIELLLYFGHEKEVVSALKSLGSPNEEKDQRRLARLYDKVIRVYPRCTELYEHASSSIKDPSYKGRVLLQGACEIAEQGDKDTALALSRKIPPKVPIIDQLFEICLMELRGEKENVTQKLAMMHFGLPNTESGIRQAIKVHKQMFYRNKSFGIVHSCGVDYERLGKMYKSLKWYFKWLSQAINDKRWAVAEALALDLKKVPHDPRSKLDAFTFHEKLVEIYDNYNQQKLEPIYSELGEGYLQAGRLEDAERIYKVAIERFKRSNFAQGLAKVYEGQAKIDHAFGQYYAAFQLALEEKNPKCISECIEKMRRLDPELQFLDESNHSSLVAIEQKARSEIESQKVDTHSKRELEALYQEVKNLESWSKVMEWVKAEGLDKLEERKRIALDQKAFGKGKWEKYLGKIGEVPEIPEDMFEIMSANNPYGMESNDYGPTLVGDTHKLILIPKTVNGKFFSLNELDKMVQKPLGGGHPTRLRGVDQKFKDVQGNRFPRKAYWMLVSRETITTSRKGTLEEKLKMYKTFGRGHLFQLDRDYCKLSLIHAATAILLEYVETGHRLFSDKSWSFCWGYDLEIQDLAIGDFNEEGLCINQNLQFEEGSEIGFAVSTKMDFALGANILSYILENPEHLSN